MAKTLLVHLSVLFLVMGTFQWHLVLTIPYVWRVTHEYINEGLKQGLKFFGKFSCQSLGYK